MKILFLNLPYTFEISRASRWPEKTKSGTMYYPYWLAYAAGYCEKNGHSVNLVDCIARKWTTEQTVAFIKDYAPNYIVTEITTPTCAYDYKTLTACKTSFPSAKLIVGGTHVTALPEEVLRACPAIDVVVRGEYEETIVNIALGTPIERVFGISYITDGNYRANENAPYFEKLDELPFVSKVYKQFLNFEDYSYAFAQKPMMQIFSARGCPHRCNFCSYPETMGGRAFRARSVDNFVDELEYISKELPEVREIFIEDDTFTVDRKRVMVICEEIKKRGLKIVWSCNTRVDLPGDLMMKMKEAGCRLLVVGYESGNQGVLDQTKKGIKLEQSLEFAKNAKKAKLKVFGCFMIGLTGDTPETIEETFRFAKRVYPDMCFFQQAVPFPGTGFYQWAKEKGYLITEDYSKWLNADGYLNCLVNYPWASPEQIEKLRDKLMGRWYFSPRYILRTFVTNLSWSEFTRTARSAVAYIKFRIKKTLVSKK